MAINIMIQSLNNISKLKSILSYFLNTTRKNYLVFFLIRKHQFYIFKYLINLNSSTNHSKRLKSILIVISLNCTCNIYNMKLDNKVLLAFVFVTLTVSSAVQDINQSQLQEIKTSKKIWLVYGTVDPSDSNSQVLHDVSQIMSGFFKFGIVSQNDGVLRLYGDDNNVVEYTGKFQIDAIIDFILSNTNAVIQARSKAANDVKANKQFLQKQKQRANKQWNDQQELRKKSNTLVLDEKNWESAFLKQRDPFFINFYESNCSACIDLNKQWEAVSTSLKGKAIVAKLNITSSQKLEDQIQLSAYPSIRYYPVGNKKVDSFELFEGVKKKFSILQWANSKLSEKKSSVDITQLNKQNYKTMCKDSKSTCVIAFVEDPSSVSAKIGELAAKYLKKPISFLVSKKGSQPEFEKQAGVQSAPDTVLMYCKGKKMLRMGGMDFPVIDEVINQITLGNRNNFVKYSFEENLK